MLIIHFCHCTEREIRIQSFFFLHFQNNNVLELGFEMSKTLHMNNIFDTFSLENQGAFDIKKSYTFYFDCIGIIKVSIHLWQLKAIFYKIFRKSRQFREPIVCFTK